MSLASYADLVAAERLGYATLLQSLTPDGSTTWALAATTVAAATTPGTAYESVSNIATFPSISPIEKHLTEFIWSSTLSTSMSFWLFDRLVGVSQDLTTTGNKTINSTALTRYTTGADVMVWLEVTTVTSSGFGSFNLASYTNQNGDTGRVGASMSFGSTSMNVGSWVGPMPLQAGDTGVRSVETLSINTASAGFANVVLVKPILLGGVPVANTPSLVPFFQEFICPPRIYDGCSLNLIFIGTTGADQPSVGLTIALSS